MNRIIETLERHGLITVDLARSALERLPLRKIVSLANELTTAIDEEDTHFPPPPDSLLDPFSFLASASVRADAGCAAIDCRVQRLKLLARYSALYCDYVAVPFGWHLYPELGVARLREDFLERLVTIIILRPLIEAGIIRLFRPSRCNHCMQLLPTGVGISELAKTLAKQRFRQFTATYLPSHPGVAFRIEGPADFIDHGTLIRSWDEPPKWLSDKLRLAPRNTKLSLRDLKASHLIEDVFEEIAVDVIHQRLEAAQRPLNYLMGRRGEAEFLSRLNADHELEERTAALCAHLTHTVPTLMDVPLSTVLSIRRKDHLSFQEYRDTIRGIARDYLRSGGTVSPKDAQQIYLDVLRPRVDKLKNEVQHRRRHVRRNSMISVGVPVALLSIGVIGGVLPAEVVGLLKISGTLGLVNEGLKALLAPSIPLTASKRDSLSFLLELDVG